jgi:hypothetical protein
MHRDQNRRWNGWKRRGISATAHGSYHVGRTRPGSSSQGASSCPSSMVVSRCLRQKQTRHQLRRRHQPRPPNHTNTQLKSPTSHGRQRPVQTAALLRRRGWQIAGTAHHSSWVNAPSQRVGGEGELHPFLRQRALPDTVPNQTPRGCKCRRQSIAGAVSLTRIGYLTSAGPTTPAQFTSTCTLPTAIWIRCARPMHAREFSGRPHQHASVPAAGITASIYQHRSPHSPARSRGRRRPTPGRSA